jgi:hypothetical protein
MVANPFFIYQFTKNGGNPFFNLPIYQKWWKPVVYLPIYQKMAENRFIVYQAELHCGTRFDANAVALMMKSLTLNLMPSFSFCAFRSPRSFITLSMTQSTVK